MPKNGRVDVEIYMLSLEEYIRGQFYHLDLHIGVFCSKKDLRKSKKNKLPAQL